MIIKQNIIWNICIICKVNKNKNKIKVMDKNKNKIMNKSSQHLPSNNLSSSHNINKTTKSTHKLIKTPTKTTTSPLSNQPKPTNTINTNTKKEP